MTEHSVGIVMLLVVFSWILRPYASAQTSSVQMSSGQKQGEPAKDDQDPFSDLAQFPSQTKKPDETSHLSWQRRLFKKNFGFRKEIMSQFDTRGLEGASRQSVGFEVQKKFSTETSTIASFDVQARLVRRDGFNPVLNDMEGQSRPGWAFEYHNLYFDFYNVLNRVLSEEERKKVIGKVNLRAGRFYVPFGLNLQTDTHGTVLQLSNEENFGFERDWYTGLWGSLNRHVDYNLHYLAGSGYDLKYKGQSGLGALRLSLANKYSAEHGLEGGISFLGGERLVSPMKLINSVSDSSHVVDTMRTGIDGRYRHVVPAGTLTFTSEITGGTDAPDTIVTQLYQADYLRASRRWGASTQYRHFHSRAEGTDAYIIAEFSYYLRNDVANSNLHWIKLNVQRQLESRTGQPNTIVTLQYYFYR